MSEHTSAGGVTPTYSGDGVNWTDETITGNAPVNNNPAGYFTDINASNILFTDGQSTNTTYRDHSSRTAKILTTLKPADRTGHYITPCMVGTREYIFKEIDKWLDSYEEPNILWLSGSPGAGKSAIASSMVSRLTERSRLGSSFFFKRRDDTLGDPATLWRTVAYDLAQHSPIFADTLVETLRRGKVDVGRPDIDLHFKHLIEEPLMKIYSSSIPPIIVIDALDECDYDGLQESQRRVLLDTFVRWSSFPKTFKLIITGRDDRVTGSLRNAIKQITLPTGSEVNTEANNDIRFFFQKRFSESSGLNFLTWPEEKDIDDLTARAAGLFIWAEIVTRLVKQDSTQHQLRLIVDGVLEKGDRLSELYEQILDISFKDTNSHTLEVVKLVISTIALAQVPFHRDDLHIFLSKQQSLVDFVLDKLSSVIFTGPMDRRLRIGHMSFSDFMSDPDRCPEAFVIDLNKERHEMAMACFRRMKAGLKFNICDLETSYLRNKEVENLSELIEKKIPGSLLYSCRFWGIHLRDTVGVQDDHMPLLEEVKDFFDHRFLFWLEVMSLVEEVLAANAVVITAIPWIEELDTRLSAFATDASRFIINFDTLILDSVPHIYLSALPFSPSESLIAQHYEQQFPNTLSVVSGRDRHWPAMVSISRGHTDEVNSVEFSKNGKWIVSGSDDKTICIWDAHTGQQVAGPLEGHTHVVASVAFSPNARLVVSGSWDKTVRVWDVNTGQVTAGPFEGHAGCVNTVAFSPNGALVVSGSDDNTIRIWDVEKSQLAAGPCKGHTSRVNSVAFSPNGERIVSGSDDNTIRMWDAKTGQEIAEPFSGPNTEVVTSVVFSQGGHRVVSGWSDGTVRIWNVETRQVKPHSFEGHEGAITCVASSINGKRVVLGSSDNTIRIWDVEKEQVVAGPLEGHVDWVSSVAFSRDGKRVVSGSYDNTIRIWDVETGQEAAGSSDGHIDAVTSISLSSDDNRIVSGSHDNTICIWDVKGSQLIAGPLQGHTDHINSVVFSQDGRRLVSGSNDNTVCIWDTNTGRLAANPFDGHTSHVYSVSTSQDDKRVVSGSGDNTIRVWDIETGQIAAGPFEGHTDCVRSVAFSPDGKYVVSGSDDKTIRVWDVEACHAVAEPFEGHTSVVASVAFSSDGRQIVSGSWDNTVRIWDVESSKVVVGPLKGHTNWVRSVAFSRDNKWVISGSDDRTIRIWSVDTGEEVVGPLRGHTHYVTSVAFSSDGRRVVSGSYDTTIRVWDIETCQTLHIYARDMRYIETGWLCGPVQAHEGLADEGQGINDSSSELGRDTGILFWVPKSSRLGLCGPETSAVFGSRMAKLDLSRFVYGKSWTRCYSNIHLYPTPDPCPDTHPLSLPTPVLSPSSGEHSD